MSAGEINKLLEKAIDSLGAERVAAELKKLGQSDDSNELLTLTIVVNAGVHHLPNSLCRGDVYLASEGSLDFSSSESVSSEIKRVLNGVARKLKERNWQLVYLVPFGPTNLSMLIKLLVFRVTHIETIDVFHAGKGMYQDLEINLRALIVEAE